MCREAWVYWVVKILKCSGGKKGLVHLKVKLGNELSDISSQVYSIPKPNTKYYLPAERAYHPKCAGIPTTLLLPKVFTQPSPAAK